VLAGARCADRDIIVVMDADLSHPADRIAALIDPIAVGEADMVIGSRYAPGGETPGWPWTRRVASRLAAALAWPLTDVRDSLSGFFALRRARLLEIPADAAGFKIGLEALVRGGESLRVREVPITFRDRTRGQSKMKLHVILAYVARLLAFSGVPVRNMERAGFFTVTGVLVDLTVFHTLLFKGAGLGAAHIAGFATASVVNYFFRMRPALDRSGRKSDRRLKVHLLAVLLMALFLRGGVLALLAGRWGWPPEVAILFAIAAALLVTMPGKAFCFSSATRRFGAGMRWRMIAMAVVAYAFVLRLVYLGQPELMPEEAYYWNYSAHPDIGYLDHPPMVAWLAWLGTAVFGRSEFGVRIGAFGCWMAASLFAFGLARNLFSKSAGFVTVLLMQVLPFFFSTGLLMTPDSPLTACWAGALYSMERAFIGNRSRAWWLVGLFMGLGMISKYSIGLVAAAAAVFILVDPPSRRWLLRWEPYAGTVLALVIFSPVIIWNAQTDWASFAFQTTRRLAEKARFSLHALIGSAAVMVTPTGIAAGLLALVSCGKEVRRDPCMAARRRALFILVFTVVPLSVFIAFSLRHKVKLEWTGPLWIAVLPAIAAAMIAPAGSASRPVRWVHRAWEPTILILLLLYGAGFHYLVLGLPCVGYRAPMHLVPIGWREMARQIDLAEESVKKETGQAALVVGLDRYFTSSEFAFYSADPRAAADKAAGMHLFGMTSLMYERWFPAFLQEGRNVVLVGWTREELMHPVFEWHSTRLGPIERGVLSRDGKPIHDFHHRVLYGYRAEPQK
jgi:dolichol-phosphate mannosyltransferase